ncbi:cold-shock DNA-binding domain protein [Nitzschia inconspicua]|uniref:Cold-shock DNA-binding domain protein n=1 Tax=Nitzschia inconspicua TaxID=303405 RepID=A0A9K3PIS8_9STRA|nr:cold-shock DNA-binding domain protein [Nitzschia inconspicua]
MFLRPALFLKSATTRLTTTTGSSSSSTTTTAAVRSLFLQHHQQPITCTTTSMASRMMMSSSAVTNDNIQTGTVKWFDSKKGFGFISPDDDSMEDIFVHQTAIHAEGFRSLADGEPVEFTTLTDAKGKLKAENVTGPMGAFVQGQPRMARPFGDGGNAFRGGGNYNNNNNNNNYRYDDKY